MSEEIKFHPVQGTGPHVVTRLRTEVTLRAYEVYCHVFGPQRAMVENGCRGGFSTGEIVAFLYARSFPKEEWSARFDEAIKGMKP